MTRRNESACRAQPGTTSRQAPSHLVRFAVLPMALALSACAQDRPLAEMVPDPVDARLTAVPTHNTTPYRAPPEPTDSRASHCAADESVLISCRISGSEDVASICVPESGPDHTYYAYGPAAHPILVLPIGVSRDRSRPMHSAHRWVVGNTFGYSFSFHHDGSKHVFYSISYTRREPGDQGVMVIAEDASEPSSVSRCDPESFIEVDHAVRTRLTHGWAEDRAIAGDKLPARDDGEE